jgi:uncharacterized protein YceH (UPF0502 family)
LCGDAPPPQEAQEAQEAPAATPSQWEQLEARVAALEEQVAALLRPRAGGSGSAE